MSESTRKVSTKPNTKEVVETEFRKANESIGLRVVEGKFSLLARKLYNVFIYHAQLQGVPGLNAPRDTTASSKYFWIPMASVIKDASYDSKDSEMLKEHVQALTDIKVIGETDTEWTSEKLLAGVKIVNTKGLRNKGGTVWFGFAFPPEVQEMVLKPNTFTRLSLHFQSVLRSATSLALYEVTRRYATSPSHLTAKKEWHWWYAAITGNPINGESPPQYKYFKRDTLLKAIKEINMVTDIEIELVEFKSGRSIKDLQFRVSLTSQPGLAFDDNTLIDSSIIERMLRFGLSEADAQSLYSSYDEKLITDTIEYVQVRLDKKTSKPIDAPGAYFKKALKDGYAKSYVAKPTELPKEAPRAGNDFRARCIAARSRDAVRMHEELSEDEQKENISNFSLATDTSIRQYLKKKGLNMPIVRSAFGEWYATQVWGEVTDAVILAFLETETLSTGE